MTIIKIIIAWLLEDTSTKAPTTKAPTDRVVRAGMSSEERAYAREWCGR